MNLRELVLALQCHSMAKKTANEFGTQSSQGLQNNLFGETLQMGEKKGRGGTFEVLNTRIASVLNYKFFVVGNEFSHTLSTIIMEMLISTLKRQCH